LATIYAGVICSAYEQQQAASIALLLCSGKKGIGQATSLFNI